MERESSDSLHMTHALRCSQIKGFITVWNRHIYGEHGHFLCRSKTFLILTLGIRLTNSVSSKT